MRACRFIAVIVTCSLLSAFVRGAELPRYKLPLGRKIVYTSTGESKPTRGEGLQMSTSGSVQATVVAENPDGSRRVILRSASAYTQNRGGNEEKSPVRVEMAYADLFPDGRVKTNPSLGMRVDPAMILPPLPKDEGELAKGWTSVQELSGNTNHYAAAGSADGPEFTFTATEDGVVNKIYMTSRKITHHLDRAKGILSGADAEFTQDWGFHSKGTNTTKLESDTTVTPDEAKELAADFEKFFSAREKYQDLMKSAEKQPDKADASIAEAKAAIEKASGEVSSDDAKKELATMLQSHEEYAKYVKESSTEFKNLLNQPSPAWEATDIDGKAAKLADYKGKVVVMDFWYRGCGWCVYAMPQVKQLALDYKDKGAVVLGMNTDSDVADAKFVIDAFGLPYQTIRADGIDKKYNVSAFPTLIILDKEGVVRDIHSGYSPELRKDVGAKVDELLKK